MVKIESIIIILRFVSKVSGPYKYKCSNGTFEYYFNYYINNEKFEISTRDEKKTQCYYDKLVEELNLYHNNLL